MTFSYEEINFNYTYPFVIQKNIVSFRIKKKDTKLVLNTPEGGEGRSQCPELYKYDETYPKGYPGTHYCTIQPNIWANPPCCTVNISTPTALKISCPDGYRFLRLWVNCQHCECIDKCVGNQGKCRSACSVFCGNLDANQSCKRGNNAYARCAYDDCKQLCDDPICDQDGKCGEEAFPKDDSNKFCFYETSGCSKNQNGDMNSANWALSPVDNCQNPDKAWILCEYYFDFKDYDLDNPDKYLPLNPLNCPLYNYLLDFITSEPYLPVDFVSNAVYVMLITQCTYLFYSTLYRDPTLYIQPKNNFQFFQNCSIFLGKNDLYFKPYIEKYITPIINILFKQYKIGNMITNKDLEVDKDFFSYQSNLFLLPRITVNEETKEIILYLTLNIMDFYTYDLTSDTFLNYITNIANNLFRTKNGQIIDITKKNNPTPISLINFIKINEEITFNVFNYGTKQIEIYQDLKHIIGKFNFSFNVGFTMQQPISETIWLYMSNLYPEEIKKLCSSITFPKFLPFICWNGSDCQNDPSCFKTTTLTQCKYKISIAFYNVAIVQQQDQQAQKSILSSYSDDCKCLTSNIVPISFTPYNNKTSLCFDEFCTDEKFVTAYELQDNVCINECSTLKSWLYTSNPAHTAQNKGEINSEKFKNICRGINTLQVDWIILIFSVSISIAVGVYLYYFFSRNMMKLLKKIIVISIIMIFLLGISIYISLEFTGMAYCKTLGLNETYHCQSQILKIPLNKSFCHNFQFCECAFDGDCSKLGKGYKCLSGACDDVNIPLVFSKTTKTIFYNYIYGILDIILCIIIVSMLYYLFGKRKYGKYLCLCALIFILSIQFFFFQLHTEYIR